MLPQTRLQGLNLKSPFMIAPMVGISHVAFRELIRHYTPRSIEPLVFTEMLSSRRIPNQRLDLADRLFCAENETHFVPQLLANEEPLIRDSIKKLSTLNPWGYDINMGCPSMKTLNHNWGVLLMGDKEYAGSVVAMAKRYSDRPISVKLRAGMGKEIDLNYLLEFTEKLEKSGADWMTIHCRSSEQRHRGIARWDIVGEIAKRRNIPVVANGDIQTASDAIQVISDHQVDGAMIARAAVARPWILLQIADALGLDTEGKEVPKSKEEEGKEYFRSLIVLCDLLKKHFTDEANSLYRLKYHVGIGHRWLPFGHDFWKSLQRIQTLDEAKDRILSYSEKYPQDLYPRVQW